MKLSLRVEKKPQSIPATAGGPGTGVTSSEAGTWDPSGAPGVSVPDGPWAGPPATDLFLRGTDAFENALATLGSSLTVSETADPVLVPGLKRSQWQQLLKSLSLAQTFRLVDLWF